MTAPTTTWAESGQAGEGAAGDAPTELARALVANVSQVVRGHDAAVEVVVAAMLAGGHVLLEDIPGSGKTTLAKAVARSWGGSFRRVQGTADLLPADVTGSLVWDGAELRFTPGPVFSHLLLVDEVNRSPARTQSALMEAMEEGTVTVDGQVYALPQPFVVVATQNALDHHGTYPLPEGQLDRFAVRVSMGALEPLAEVQVVREQLVRPTVDELQAVTDPQALLAARTAVRSVHASDALLGYAVALCRATRQSPRLRQGAGPRAGLALVRCAQAWATLRGRSWATPDDLHAVALPVLVHRLVDRLGVSGGDEALAAVHDALSTVPVPPRA